jgi:heptaprenylglyceryl phosphate synthase
MDVKKYVPGASDKAISGIVRYCGIALQSRDASMVAFSDATETARVRDNFLKKKLGLAHSDADLDRAIAAVGDRMKADRTKNRVTVYYLLAEHFDKLAMFG